MRILLVDDNDLVTDALRDFIRYYFDEQRPGEPHPEVSVSASYATARTLLAEEDFDFVVLDGNLGDGFGPELYAEFRDRLKRHGTRVVVHSGEDPDDLRRKFPVLVEDRIKVLTKSGRDPVPDIFDE